MVNRKASILELAGRLAGQAAASALLILAFFWFFGASVVIIDRSEFGNAAIAILGLAATCIIAWAGLTSANLQRRLVRLEEDRATTYLHGAFRGWSSVPGAHHIAQLEVWNSGHKSTAIQAVVLYHDNREIKAKWHKWSSEGGQRPIHPGEKLCLRAAFGIEGLPDPAKGSATLRFVPVLGTAVDVACLTHS